MQPEDSIKQHQALADLTRQEDVLRDQLGKITTAGGRAVDGFETEWHQKHAQLDQLTAQIKTLQTQTGTRMATDTRVKEIEAQLTEINGLNVTARRERTADLIEIRAELDGARRDAADEQLGTVESLTRRYKGIADDVADYWQTYSEGRIKSFARGKRPMDLDEYAAALKDAGQALKNVVALVPTRDGSTELQELNDTFADLEKELTSLKRVQDIQADVGAFWADADRIESADLASAVSYTKQAFEKAEGALRGNWEPRALDELTKLRNKANTRYEEIRKRHEVPTTRDTGEKIVQVFYDLAGLPSDKSVTYFENESVSAIAKTMTVSAALKIAGFRLIDLFWRPTMERYIAEAKGLLAQHKPRDAMAALERCDTISGRNDDRVRNDDGPVLWPQNFDINIAAAKTEIQPEFDAYKRAENFVAKANQEQDPVTKFGLYRDAVEAYIFYPDLDTLHAECVAVAKVELATQLEQADEKLHAEAWAFVNSRLERAGKLLELDQSLRDEYQDQHTILQQLYQQILPWTPARPQPITLNEEQLLLERLRDDSALAAYWKGWAHLQKRLADLQARSNVQFFIQQANKAGAANAILETLQELERQCQEFLTSAAPELAQYREQLQEAAIKLEAWIGYVRARDELAKITQLTPSDGESEEAIDAPDLEIAKEGIKTAGKDDAARRAAQKLQTELGKFEAADTKIENALTKLTATLAEGTVDTLMAALKEISKALATPTSHRRALLALKRQAQTALAEQIEIEVEQTLANARQVLADPHADPLAKIKRSRLELLATTYKGLPVQEADVIKNRTALLIQILKAYEIQGRAEKGLDEKKGVMQWETARKAWESAAEAADDDLEFKDLALHHAKLAYKHNEFQRARREPDANTAETILAVLQNDTLLRNEWDIWYEHGKHCLDMARELLRQDDPRSSLSASAALLNKARFSLNRALKLVVDAAERARISSDLGELNEWDTFGVTARTLQNHMEISSGALTYNACKAARDQYTDTYKKRLANEETNRLLETFWNNQRAAARQKLTTQIADSNDIFEKLDAYLGMDALYPGESWILGQMATLMIDAASQMRAETKEVVFDYTAQKFFNRLTKQAQDELNHKDIIQLQLRDTDRALGNVERFNTAMELLPSTLIANNSALSGLDLAQEKKELGDWRKQLEVFQKAADQALTLIERGLRQPQAFEIARFILRLGEGGSPLAERVPDAFRNDQHPTLRWLIDQLYRAEERRAQQERLRARAETCLRLERVERAEELGEAKDVNERALFNELRQKLQAPTQRTYPLEEALKALRAMANEEKHDVCGLQESMTYSDPDNFQQLYSGLPQIEPVIANKVTQVQILRRWLGDFRAGDSAAIGVNPGFVNWDAKKVEIERARDSHRDNLGPARKDCEHARQGDADGMYGTVWSLQKTFDALDREMMLRALKSASANNIVVDGTVVLCRPAENINQEREALRAHIQTQIEDSKKVEENIAWRIKNFNARWGDFQAAQNALMRFKKDWARKPEWQEYQRCAEAFCAICPNWDEFQNALRQVMSRTGSTPNCLQKTDGRA